MKLFVWDLHGTLEEGNERAVIELSNQVLARFGYRQRFCEQDVRRLYGLKWYQYFESLMPDLTHEQYIELQVACFELSNSLDGIATISSYIQQSKHAHEVLEAIHARHKQILISNTVPESVPLFVQALGMSKFFDRTNSFAVDNHATDVRTTKLDVLAEYMHNQTFEKVVVIGDSDSDMALADAIGGFGYMYAHYGLDHRSARGRRISDLADILVEL